MTKPKIAFLDVDVFAKEGFTNGIFLTIREFFKRFEKQNIPCSIISISQSTDKKRLGSSKKIINKRSKTRGITIENSFLQNSLSGNTEEYAEAIEKSLKTYQPSLIFMYTPAVFFEDIHIEALKKSIQTGAKVVVLLADSLYPTEKKHPSKNVKKYYKLLRKTKVICTSKLLINKFYREIGIKPKYFPNIFSPDEIICKPKNREYISLVNHHPIKGIEIFNQISIRMPEKKFMVVETWPDVPKYKIPSKNVIFSDFIPDVRKLYAMTKIILIPSLYEEGPSRLMVEAMLNHIPVIANNIGCLPEEGKDFAKFIDPPKIDKSEMINTVIYPRVSKKELDKTVDAYIKAIEEIDKNKKSLKNYSSKAFHKAMHYCNQTDHTFEQYANEWLS